MLRGLRPEQESVEYICSVALYAITGNNDFLKELTKNCLSDQATVRGSTALHLRYLGKMRVRHAPPELVALLNDPEARVRRAAALALSEIRDPSTLTSLISTAANEKIDIPTRGNCVVGIGLMPAEANRKDILELLESLLENPKLKAPAKNALANITETK